MKNLLLTLLLGTALLSHWQVSAKDNPDYPLVIDALNNYIEGTSYNNREQIAKAFAKDSQLLLEKDKNAIWSVPVDEYISWFAKRTKGEFNGRIGNVLAVDIDGRLATAKVEIMVPEKSSRYLDTFLLKKLNNQWKIIAKAAVKADFNNSGERILFIVSSAHFHGDTDLPAGVSFSEIVKAYNTFTAAGYTVDFVSPAGGAIPLSYINTSIEEHKNALYNNDFMQKLKHTMSPDQVEAGNYRAVHYVGGSNAMYQVADNSAIKAIAMAVYEDHNGIISSVCHGTAGIVNLKTKDGKYLVSGKRISGYPESFENQSREYFKAFPFLIQQTVEDRGGEFIHSARNRAHVEVDGRVITGQNHLSSSLVAQRIIELLQKG